MTDAQRNQRALIVLAAGLVAAAVAHYGFSPGVSGVSSIADNPAVAEQRLVRLRQIAATIPRITRQWRQTRCGRHRRGSCEGKACCRLDTAAQGQAALLEIASRLGKEEQLDVRGGRIPARLKPSAIMDSSTPPSPSTATSSSSSIFWPIWRASLSSSRLPKSASP